MGKVHVPRTGGNTWIDTFYHYDQPTGNVLYVHSGTGVDASGYGYSPEAPVATLDYAVGLCTANNNDVIVVMTGHAESIAGAAGVNIDVAGVTVKGLGAGRGRPTFTLSAAASSFDIAAANCKVENLVFLTGEDHAEMINVTAADCVIKDCEIVLGATGKEAVIGILAGANADRLRVENCFLHDIGVAGCDHAISFGACDHAVIKDCTITGLFAVGGAIENSAAAVDVIIDGNTILNRTPNGNNKAIVFHSSTTGMIINNRMAIIDASCPAPVTAAAAFVGGNYYTGAVGVTAGTLM